MTNISLTPQELTELIVRVEEGVISNLVGKDVFALMVETGQGADEIIKDKGLAQVSDDGALQKIVDEILNEHQTVVSQVKEGKESAVGFLVGQAMRKSGGKANPKRIGEIIKRRILDA